MTDATHVLITGASSGLGESLALQLSAPGRHLALTGRDKARLSAVATACTEKGAVVQTALLDVRDADAMKAWVLGLDAALPLDLIIANAGISGETGLPGDVPDLTRDIIDINIHGTLNTVQPVLPKMIARGAGQICLVASLAGMRGMPRGPAYSASKAAMIALADAWRVALAPNGIAVTAACPGYIYTPLTERHSFSLPFAVSADDAALAILSGLRKRAGSIIVPAKLGPVAWCFRALPKSLTNLLLPGPKAQREVPTDA